MGKYFNVTVKPPITVAALAAGNITDTEILFDWHAFDIPKGAARLVGVTILYAGKNGADYTPTDFELFWGRGDKNNFDAPETLGSDGAAVNGNGYLSHIMGKTYVDARNMLARFKRWQDACANVLAERKQSLRSTCVEVINMTRAMV